MQSTVAGFLSLIALAFSIGDMSARAQGREAAHETPAQQPGENKLRVADWLDVSFSERFRYETLDNRFRAGDSGSDQQIPQRTRIGIGVKKIIDPVRFQFEFEDSRIYLDDSGSWVTSQMVNEHDILQLHVSLVFPGKPGSRPASTLSFGRQSFDLGSRRLFARNRYRNTTNRWDGLRWSIGSPQAWNLDAFFFLPVRLRLHEMDRRVPGSRFWGVYFSRPRKQGVSTEIYYFGLWEDPDRLPGTKRRYTTIGGRAFREAKPGAFGFEAESAWQFGKAAEFDHFAHMQHLQLGYVFDAPWQPSVSGHYDYASGDKDPYDRRNDNFDSLFGARRWEYGPTGIYQWMSRTNINSPALYFGFKPARNLELLPDIRWQWLAQKRAVWVGGALRDPTGAAGSYVGSSMEWRLRYDFAPYFRPEIGYVRFFKGRFAREAPQSPTAKDSNYFFVELELRLDDLIK